MEIEGPARAILSGERTALNIVGRMAGIATAVAEAQRIASEASPSVRVAATRKTLPGLRELDKKAVSLGGGDTHRLRLDDCVLIKDNHLELIPSITDAVVRAKDRVSFTKKIEVEVRTLAEAAEAAEAGADIVMFDNMSPGEIRICLGALKGRGLHEGRLFEASGGITHENLADYAGSGVDIVSMGSLTHSVRSLNVKLEIEMV
jgi:nicotinate-nucleotide pyrophosphorylase (carboxylating)